MTDTPEPMTDARLDEIEKFADAATAGPWSYDGQHNEITTPRDERYWLIVSECRSAPDQTIKRDEFGHGFDNNFAFIAAARTDVPALVAEVRRQREESNEAIEAAAKVCVAANRMLERWSEGDENVKQFLWKRLHQANQELFIILDKRKLYPYPSVSKKPAAEASNE